MNAIIDAQRDMRDAYYSGAPGVVSSATVWLAAAVVAALVTPKAGIMTLVFGGVLIFPASVVVCKMIGRSGKHNKNNPLAPLAIEGTIWMLFSIPLAIGAALYRIEWFFPFMLLIIAGRYLTFSTLYGMRIYWLFAIVLAISSFCLLAMNAPVFAGAFTGALVEYIFGVVIFIGYKPAQPTIN